MRSGRLHPFRYSLLLVASFACSWAVAALATGSTARPEPEDAAAGALPSDAAYDSATTFVRERLSGPVHRSVEGMATAWIVVLRGRDLLVCEDLGRQLRELRAADGGARNVLVWTDHEDLPAVRAFLKRENLRSLQLRSVQVENLFESRTKPATPAVLLLQRNDSVLGIAHTRRFPNVRLRSFAQELQAVQEPERRRDLLDRGTRQ
ncbi:MAG: hypothetical protein AB1941_02205 [Gemmatimonadota bacterium]